MAPHERRFTKYEASFLKYGMGGGTICVVEQVRLRKRTLPAGLCFAEWRPGGDGDDIALCCFGVSPAISFYGTLDESRRGIYFPCGNFPNSGSEEDHRNDCLLLISAMDVRVRSRGRLFA